MASLLVHGREEDAFHGYIKLQKLASGRLRVMPSNRKDLFSYPIAKVDQVREIQVLPCSVARVEAHVVVREWFDRAGSMARLWG